MAYVSQELKAKLAPKIKEICRRHGVKGTISVRNHSTLVLTVKQGSIDFIDNFNRVCSQRPRPAHLPFQPAKGDIAVNVYWYHEHFDGAALAFLHEVLPAMRGPDYFDHSDSQIDYFHCSHYYDVKIGHWDKPYALEK